jgi:hypothetical protein
MGFAAVGRAHFEEIDNAQTWVVHGVDPDGGEFNASHRRNDDDCGRSGRLCRAGIGLFQFHSG